MQRDYLLCVPVYVDNLSTFNLTKRFVDSLGVHAITKVRLYVNSCRDDFQRYRKEEPINIRDSQIEYLTLGSVARAWNAGITETIQRNLNFITCGNDTKITDEDLDKINDSCNMSKYTAWFTGIKGQQLEEGKMPFVCWGANNLMFQKLKAIELVHGTEDYPGLLDENFWPAYFEDCDFHKRIKRAEIQTKAVEGVEVEHEVSSTLKLMDKENAHYVKTVHFDRNKARHFAKWGEEY